MNTPGIARLVLTVAVVVAPALISLLSVGTANGAAPPFEPPQAERRLYDMAGAFPADARRAANQSLRELETRSGARLVVYTHIKPASAIDITGADADAAALLSEWALDSEVAAALVWAFDGDLAQATVGVAVSERFASAHFDAAELRTIVDASTSTDLDAARWLAGLTRSTVAVSAALPSTTPSPGGPSPSHPDEQRFPQSAPSGRQSAGRQPAGGWTAIP